MFNFNAAVSYLLLGGMLFLSIMIFFCLYFMVKVPKLTDKIIATNMISIKAVILIILVALYLGETFLLDVALVFALLSFLATIIFTKMVLQYDD